MKKVNLKATSILNKKFGVELSGYNPSEVDAFLDEILEDYNTYEELVKHLESQIVDKTKLINDKEAEIEKLKMDMEITKEQLARTGKATNVEMLDEMKRMRREVEKLQKVVAPKE